MQERLKMQEPIRKCSPVLGRTSLDLVLNNEARMQERLKMQDPIRKC